MIGRQLQSSVGVVRRQGLTPTVREDGGEEKGIDLDKVHSWSRLEETQEAYIVLVPKKKHQEDSRVAAKMVELMRYLTWYRISTTWVLWQKKDEIRARLVAHGYENNQVFAKYSPTWKEHHEN